MRMLTKKLGCTATALAFLLSIGSVMPTSTLRTEAASETPLFHAEAENCTITEGATVETTVYGTEYPGYSGDGFVWAGNAGGVSFDITLEESAMYEFSTSCWMYLGDPGSTRLQTLAIDGEVISSQYIPNNESWSDFSFGYFYLEAGTHTIELGASGSWGFILYDTVTFDYADMPELNIAPNLIDPDATPETKALMQYLTENYGNHIISGQQEIYGGGNDGNTELEFEYIYDNTGKYPVIRGFDLMNYNPLYGWEDGSTGRMIQWVTQRGGIATASWHINVPIDFENYEVGDFVDWKECTYKNYQASNSTFNTANILVEDSKERAYFNEAVRMLAEQLLILQDANVPVIFRPLHEAQGNYGRYGDGTAWFWWGDRGPEVYKELWKLLYTMLTEEYGVHNCIWELNLYELDNSIEWYPGDEYVDMVAYDKYEGSPYKWGFDPATSVFLSLVNATNDTKMVALAENDVIPAVDGMVNEGAWWSYFCPWYGSFLTDGSTNPVEHLNEIYNSEYVITLDEVPNDLYGYVRGNGGVWDVDGAYECEEGTVQRNEGTSIIDYKYCSGTGYVYLQGAGDYIEQTITVDEAGTYYLIYGYQQNFEKAGKTQNLYVNGESVGTAFFPYSILFGEAEGIAVELKAGDNTIKLESEEGWTYFDYLRVVPENEYGLTTTVTTAITEETTTTTTTTKLYGDVDCDGSVSIVDVVMLARYVSQDAEVKLTATGLENADCDADSLVTADDLTLISRYISGLANSSEFG